MAQSNGHRRTTLLNIPFLELYGLFLLQGLWGMIASSSRGMERAGLLVKGATRYCWARAESVEEIGAESLSKEEEILAYSESRGRP